MISYSVILSAFFALALQSGSTAAYVPGQLRRTFFGSPSLRLQLPQVAVDSTLAALKKGGLKDSLPHVSSAIWKTITSIPADTFIAKRQKSEVFAEEHKCLLAQQEARSLPPSKFMYEIKPESMSLDPSDKQAQEEWFAANAAKLKHIKSTYGCIYFKGWEILKDQDGLASACEAMGMDTCADPAEILRPRPALDGKKDHIFEASNSPRDSHIHIGMHTEGTPGGIRPKSAFFACFKKADTGGEFLLCDGRRVLRDIDSKTLEAFEARGYRAEFAEIPNWLSKAPGLLSHVPLANIVHQEMLSLAADFSLPSSEYLLSPHGEHKLALTSKSYSVIGRHEYTGEPFWFCNIDALHRCLFEKRNPIATGSKFDTRAFDLTFGDGGPIGGKVLDDTADAIEKNTKAVSLAPGDGIFLDNSLTMHGRQPFTGERKHAVIWCSN